jgi:predicted ribosomally synthesized peptide with nif11-like leader
MSKETVLNFLSEAAKNEQLKLQLEATSNPDELIDVANEAGYDFSAKHVDEALSDLKKQPGFFGALAEAVLQIFSPHNDDYPATGMQPFSGDPNKKS